MNLHGYTFGWISLTLLLATACSAGDYDAEPADTHSHEHFPRFLNVFSRPSHEAGKQRDVGFKQHLSNVMNGGTIGVHAEFRPLAPIHGFLDKAKKFLPKPGFIEGIFHPGRRPDGYEPEWKPKPIKPGPGIAETEDWEDNAKRPNKGGPKWEDIGEEDDYPSVPIEDIIQPRVRRPKRFVDSRIYHVPLEFVSNAKPVHVKVQSKNHV